MERIAKTVVFKPIEGFFFFIIIAISIGLLATPYYAYAIIPILVVVFLFLIGRWPQIGFYLIIFLIPFDAFRGLSSSFQYLTISKLLGLWVVILTLFYILFKKKLPIDLQSNLWPWFFIFFVISFLSALLSDYRLTAFNTLRQLFTAYIFFALALIFISNRGFFRIFPAVVIVSITISSLFAIIGYVFNIELFAVNIERIRRAIGTAGDPNFFSSMIIFCLPLVLHWFFSSRAPGKIIAIACLIINIVAVILTYSRGGAVVLASILVILLIEHMWRFRPRYLGFVMSIITIAIAATIIFIPSSYWSRQKSVSIPSDESIAARISYLYVGWDAFKKDPLLGSGPGTYKDIYGGTMYAFQYHTVTAGDDSKSFRRYAHNTYVEILVGTGLLGLVIFLAIIWLVLRNFHRAKKYLESEGRKNAASIVGAYRISFISMLLYFFLISAIHHKYFWVSFALSQIALKVSKELKEEGWSGRTVIPR
jgi:putative inorganic carbon (HCO3(-)) transporter